MAGALAAYPVDPLVLDEWELDNLFDAEFGAASGVPSVPRRREIRLDHEALWSTGRHDPRPSQRPPDPPISDAERAQFGAFHGPRTQLYACVLPGELVQKCVQMLEAGTLDPAEQFGIEHLIVDEFQDLNPMDLRFVYGIEAAGARLFVAGDDDQSLYSFRYANPEGIQRFADTPPVGDHVLRHCFRCTPAVLSAATSLIEGFAAPGRIPKHLVSLYAESDPPVDGGFGCWRFRDGTDEARAIARSCRLLIDAGLPAREIMVLLSNVRALDWQLRAAFGEFDVPFEPPRTERFTDTATGRALYTLLRIVSRPHDYVALRTLLALRHGVGIGTASSIADSAIREDLNYHDLFYVDLPVDVFAGRQLRALSQAREVSARLAVWSAEDLVSNRQAEISEMLELILGEPPDAGWEAELQLLPEGASLADLAGFLSAEKDDQKAAALVTIHARLGREVTFEQVLPERVRVMTMHGAKGLSATMVFIPGLEEEILPGERRARFPGQVLEAARMVYVSITRARVGCIVSYAQRRFINGQLKPHHPSRYTAHFGQRFSDGGVGISEETARVVAGATQSL